MAISCFTLPNRNPLRRLQTKFHRRSTLEEIPEGRRLSFEQFLDNHYAATQQRHDSPQEQDSFSRLDPPNAPSPARRTFYSDTPSPDRRPLYRYSSTETVSVIDTNSDPRSPVPTHQHGHPRSPIPTISSFIDATSEETITILYATNHQRDSKDTSVIPSLPLQNGLKTYLSSHHPAIVDNPPPFARYSEPPISHQLAITSPAAPHPRQRLNRQQSLHHLLHQRTQLHASRERLADCLEATTQDLSLATEQLHLAQEELLIREHQTAKLRSQLTNLEKSYDGAIRTLNGMSAELREVKGEHESCSRWFGCGRKTPWLKKYRVELRAKLEGSEVALKIARSEMWAMHERFQTQELQVAGLKELVGVQSREMEIKHEALLVGETEMGGLSGRLRMVEEALRSEKQVGDGMRQHCRDLQLEIACLKHRDSARTV
ncbi:uncharacterized protein MYCGRDRAFT_91524 [Zymoseptoria tritici IPO323]|uniref:Uncharacterized protein n=1 Tax=Zymoseptoria tritici (strain CBS 115943 / IPO323) TaxID=336722 RepID=F9X5M1_ZYMTI|nr:uncharacterized protein MYCGRDRAFT_91524 [Zymoseptoria tritici IPO323]EGP89508.1 hypothetical protein MYCGRDRAFT_91524 [Zymoseptoria tritici IPO323]